MFSPSEVMSEFKYACPVCGQHIKCDTSQSGTVMDCPTCFQKIVAPQASTNPDPKFVLTGQKYSEKKTPTTVPGAFNTAVGPQGKRFPVAAVMLVLVVLAAGAGAFVYRGKIFKSAPPTGPDGTAATTPGAPPPAPAREAPVAPSASDTNWTLDLAGAEIPDGPVVGRIHGQDFISARATFQNGSLTFRAESHGPFELGAAIDFKGEQPEVMAGKSFNITTNVDQAAKLTLRWKEDDKVKRASFKDGYALRLEFGALVKNRLSGKIYLCAPDETKSYLMGTFNADARKPKPKAPPKT